MQKVIVLPKDDQEVEELMLEEVEVFKVGGPARPCSGLLDLLWPCPLTLDWLRRGPERPQATLTPAFF